MKTTTGSGPVFWVGEPRVRLERGSQSWAGKAVPGWPHGKQAEDVWVANGKGPHRVGTWERSLWSSQDHHGQEHRAALRGQSQWGCLREWTDLELRRKVCRTGKGNNWSMSPPRTSTFVLLSGRNTSNVELLFTLATQRFFKFPPPHIRWTTSEQCV